VVLRPDALEIGAGSAEAWRGKVINRRFTGGSAVYKVQTADDIVLEVNTRRMDIREGETTAVTVKREPVPIVGGDED
ncbi:MAG TPA: TOBE domain-containing protein, partial [Gemmatimonadaceae bacterium]|nr:TOBE domain-containing protein [Gemmatimonadaceae bacterium]